MMRARFMTALILAAFAGCGTGMPAATYPDPTAADSKPNALDIRLIGLTSDQSVTTADLNLAVAVTGPHPVARVWLIVDAGAERLMQLGTDGQWHAKVALLAGANAIVVHALDSAGHSKQRPFNLRYAGNAPTVRLLEPVPGAVIAGKIATGQTAAELVLKGQAQAAEPDRITAVQARIGDGAWTSAKLTKLGVLTAFEVALALDPQLAAATVLLELRATDSANRATTRQLVLRRDDVPPTIQLAEPLDGAQIDGGLVQVSGTAGDDGTVDAVAASIDGGPWIRATGTTSFTLAMPIDPGGHTLTVRATDAAGNTATAAAKLFRRRSITLTATALDAPGGPMTLTLDKAQVHALVTPAKAKEIVIYYLDVRGLLVEAINAVKAPDAYGIDTTAWGKPEWNLQRIVTMQPDNTIMAGTAFAELAKVSGALGIAMPAFVAQLADIPPTQTYLSTKEVADAMFRTVLSSHPALKVDPADGIKKLPITLYDAMNDLADLAVTLGPQGDHPGVLWKATPSAVLRPDFAMTLHGTTNLRKFDGVDLSNGKAWLLSKKPGADVVNFDFTSDKTFTVKGVADEPQVDLFFQVKEHAGFVAGGKTKGGVAHGGFAIGTSKAWELPAWTFERLVIDAVYHAYRAKHAPSFTKTWLFDVGTLKDASKAMWDHGWLQIETVAGIGNPPPPAYWWDMVSEIAQVRLHDGGIAEGQANMRLAVSGVTVPVTAKEMIDRTRQLFEEQKSTLTKAAVGDHSSYDTACDFFAVKHQKGLSLWFVEPADVPGAKVPHGKRGFFADAALSQKQSSTSDDGSGDTDHEKLALQPGVAVIVFAQDTDGSTWRLEASVLDGSGLEQDRVRVRLAPVATKTP